MEASVDTTQPARPYPRWFRLLMPSLRDVIFFFLFYLLTFGSWGVGLLNDADTGWHIRNGEYILATRSVPHVDYFSYTMSGKPWYAWEWLYDVVVWGVHRAMGLNGVVIFTALVIATTFTLLFRMLLARGSHLLIAAGLVLLAAGASTIHFLARPHVLTWLFTPIWYQILDRFQTGQRDRLLWLPALMLLWVNIHGGFLIGLALLFLYLAGNLWTYFVTGDPADQPRARARAKRIALITGLCGLATLATPYGYKLHVHVAQYLSNSFLMDHISEFLSPSFHTSGAKNFEALLLLTLVALALSLGKVCALDVLVVLFSVHATLYAARNIPISSALMALVTAPLLSHAIDWAAGRPDLSRAAHRLFAYLEGFSARMIRMESGFNAHTWPTLLVILTLGLALNGGKLASQPVLSLQFDEKKFPVKATEFVGAQGIRDHLLTTDAWSGYLLYRLYPNIRLFMDDRHDFFGPAFVQEYLKVTGVNLGWRAVLDQHHVNWILVSPDSPLANTLKETSDWKVIYDDGIAILFTRLKPISGQPSAASSEGGSQPDLYLPALATARYHNSFLFWLKADR